MNDPIVFSQEPILLVGGGPGDPAQLLALLEEVNIVVAADGGADTVRSVGRLPDVLIGDLDSVSAETRAAMPPTAVHHVAEQDSTDFAKCIRSIEAPLIVGFGFLGGQVDHLLAVMTVLVQYPDRRIMLVSETDVLAHVPTGLDLPLKAGTRVSLFPMAPVRGRSTGLHWPIDGLDLSPNGQIGTSNRADGPVTLTTEGSGLLIILPASERHALQQALDAVHAQGPVP